METSDNSNSIEKLRALVAALRDPQSGCPWHIPQNFQSILPYIIEEVYEVADAVYRGNSEDLCEELGDLLLQLVYHARLAEEAGLFSFDDIVAAINSKLIRRHPHVFGAPAAMPDKAHLKQQWAAAKAQEKAQRKQQNQSYYLDAVSTSLPPLAVAAKLQEKTEIVGFDWVEALPVLQKAQEELAELQQAIASGDIAEQAAEYGDVLFTLVNLGRKINADFNSSLYYANQKFRRRFNFIEAALKKQHKTPATAALHEMESLWQAAKKQEKKQTQLKMR